MESTEKENHRQVTGKPRFPAGLVTTPGTPLPSGILSFITLIKDPLRTPPQEKKTDNPSASGPYVRLETGSSTWPRNKLVATLKAIQ